jgi:hypothetical protein
MVDLSALWAGRSDWFKSQGREQRIKDYMVLTNELVWKRLRAFCCRLTGCILLRSVWA